MARKPRLSDDHLYAVATYLARPDVRTAIDAELPARQQSRFEAEYRQATGNYPLPSDSSTPPYYVMGDEKDKQGRELRIYFERVVPEPPIFRGLYTDRNKWKSGYRINHSNLVEQLFECGFVLGPIQDPERIAEFMRRRFPVSC